MKNSSLGLFFLCTIELTSHAESRVFMVLIDSGTRMRSQYTKLYKNTLERYDSRVFRYIHIELSKICSTNVDI